MNFATLAEPSFAHLSLAAALQVFGKGKVKPEELYTLNKSRIFFVEGSLLP